MPGPGRQDVMKKLSRVTLSLISCHSCNICEQRKGKGKLCYLQRMPTDGWKEEQAVELSP